jgi:protein arginine kinase
MTNNIHEFLTPPARGSLMDGPNMGIVLSSRVRLARNLEGFPFPEHATEDQKVEALQKATQAVCELPQMEGAFSCSMSDLDSLDKNILVERHLISRELAAKTKGSGLVMGRGEHLCVLINEEDHLRMQAICPGLQLLEAWKAVDDLDSELENKVQYAFDSKLGYLTACATNLGTGIRVSAMLHLPGMALRDSIGQTIQAVGKLGLAVRGLYGEGTEALGNIFQISNQRTLGESEREIIEKLNKVLAQIIEHEKMARSTLLEKKPKSLCNQIGRAYGILSNAYTIASKEALNLLSLIRLGIDLEFFPESYRTTVDELFVLTQPAHLRRRFNEKLTAEERDAIRADMLRERLQNLERPAPKLPEEKDSSPERPGQTN